MPSQSAHGNTPRQLCCIGFNSSFCVGCSTCVSERLLQPKSANRLVTASADNNAFSQYFPYEKGIPFVTLWVTDFATQ